MSFYCVYVLKAGSGSYSYVGVTTDMERRLRQHNGHVAGGARCTRARRPWSLASRTPCAYTRSAAQQLEHVVKRARGLERRLSAITKLHAAHLARQ